MTLLFLLYLAVPSLTTFSPNKNTKKETWGWQQTLIIHIGGILNGVDGINTAIGGERLICIQSVSFTPD